MYRQIVIPANNHLMLDIPDNLVGHKVEVTAETIPKNKKKKKYSLEENRKFYSKFRFGKFRLKYTREELYDR